MNRQELTESGFKPSIYTLPNWFLNDGLRWLHAEPADSKVKREFQKAANLADHLQMKYRGSRPSITMAAIIFLELRLRKNPRQLKEVAVSFDVSEKSLNKRIRWVQSMGYYVRNPPVGASQRINLSLGAKRGRLAPPLEGEKDKRIATFETGWGKVSFKRRS